MTDNKHPITPPPELVEQWECEYHHMTYGPDLSIFISEKAARWGADQELEACCGLMDEWGLEGDDLMECRRPKPPSLKEQALDALFDVESDIGFGEQTSIIRRALEALPE